MIARHKNEAGEVIHPETGEIIPPELVTIEHKTNVVKHWNQGGYNMSKQERIDWYNDESNLTVLPGPGPDGNSARGAKLNMDFRQDTGPDYSE